MPEDRRLEAELNRILLVAYIFRVLFNRPVPLQKRRCPEIPTMAEAYTTSDERGLPAVGVETAYTGQWHADKMGSCQVLENPAG